MKQTHHLELIRLASNIAFRVRGEEGDLTFTDLMPPDDYSDEEVARLWLVAEEWRLSVDRMAKVIGEEWVARWRARGKRGVEVDGQLVTTKKGYTSEKCTDPDGFWEWLNTQPESTTRNLFNENDTRKGQLPESTRDTFFEKTHIIKPDTVRQAASIPVEVLDANS